MNIVLLGKNGQVGWELQRSLAPLGCVTALGSHDTAPTLCGNLTLPDQLRATIRQLKPDVIVNAAAYTAVDKAESEPQLAQQVNALGPAVLAEEAAQLGAWLVHYSTDYVFNGSGSTAWQEEDATGPLNTYGRSKLAGELAIRDSGCRHLIFRTSWVYAARGNNFAKTMLRLARERDTLNVINDQFGAPTSAELIADITAHALRTCLPHNAPANTRTSASLSPSLSTSTSTITSTGENTPAGLSGTYHLAAAGETTWFHYAQHVLACAHELGMPLKAGPNAIEPVATRAFPTPAQRPHNSRLNTTKLQDTFGLTLPAWQAGVQRMVQEYGQTAP
jgi:dTDP-4-dehydrorhamnose reductase